MAMTKRSEKTVWNGKPLPDGYEADLNRLVEEIYNEAYRRDWSWGDLARFSGLSHYTVWRLGERITKVPQHLTVWKLACAVQFRIEFTPKRPNILKDRRRAVKGHA